MVQSLNAFDLKSTARTFKRDAHGAIVIDTTESGESDSDNPGSRTESETDSKTESESDAHNGTSLVKVSFSFPSDTILMVHTMYIIGSCFGQCTKGWSCIACQCQQIPKNCSHTHATSDFQAAGSPHLCLKELDNSFCPNVSRLHRSACRPMGFN